VDAYTSALNLLARRELSARQLRERLARRKFEPDEIERVLTRLTADGTVNDRRVALACARTDAAVRGHGRRRILQHVQQLGVSAEVAAEAVSEVFGDVDERALLDSAIERRLRGASLGTLDQKAKARLVRHLVARGFEPSAVFSRLRRKGLDTDE
jgi:regulatory protein